MSEMNRAFRKTRIGTVVSDKMDKTIVVAVEDSYQHPLYKKTTMVLSILSETTVPILVLRKALFISVIMLYLLRSWSLSHE